MGAFSILPGTNHQYRLYNGLVQRWTNGIDFVRNFYDNVPLTAITDAFIGGPTGGEYIYAYQPGSGYWKQFKDNFSGVVNLRFARSEAFDRLVECFTRFDYY